ncbi:hypothetical protein [Lentzea albidocapillata]|uniref:hypothetical protein n=1 Tax=Lentzea albidocapillata TaxID=40571 RepID=UPI00115FB8CE|nr:hypothetical protein [Lentzea albidocapillata]
MGLQQTVTAGEGRDLDWQQWTQARARVQATVVTYTGDQPPPAKPGEAHRGARVERELVPETGQPSKLAAVNVYCTLVQAGAGWLVDRAEIDVEDS